MFDAIPSMAIVVGEPLDNEMENVTQLVVRDPKAAFFCTVKHFFCEKTAAVIAKSAVVETDKIGQNVSIGQFSYIGPDVEIGDDVVIGNNVSIECPTTIGEGSVIGSGVVIGTAGYGYYADASGQLQRVPHCGGVVIGKNVDIGANVTIDRGTIGDTTIGDNVKIDNLSFIAHNVKVGRSAMIVGGVIVGGSVEIGDESYLAPGAVVMNQKRVGNRALVGLGTVVVQNVGENKVVMGNPARVLPPMPRMTANPVWASREG